MDNEKESGGWNMYKLDDLFDFDEYVKKHVKDVNMYNYMKEENDQP